jgi:hypothetical protein
MDDIAQAENACPLGKKLQLSQSDGWFCPANVRRAKVCVCRVREANGRFNFNAMPLLFYFQELQSTLASFFGQD